MANQQFGCQSYFLEEKPEWLDLSTIRMVEGKIFCPTSTCGAKLGSWCWSGSQCSCGAWICPSFQFNCSKLDEIKVLQTNPSLEDMRSVMEEDTDDHEFGGCIDDSQIADY